MCNISHLILSQMISGVMANPNIVTKDREGKLFVNDFEGVVNSVIQMKDVVMGKIGRGKKRSLRENARKDIIDKLLEAFDEKEVLKIDEFHQFLDSTLDIEFFEELYRYEG